MAHLTRWQSILGINFEEINTSFLVISFIIEIVAIVLNSVEIFMIGKRWRQATNFEIILLNLAIADVFSGISFFAVTSLFTYSYVESVSDTRFMLPVFIIVVSSMNLAIKFVVMIAVERLIAIRLPLKYRMWQTNKKRMLGMICALWTINAGAVATVITIDYHIRSRKVNVQRSIGSNDLLVVMAAYMTFGASLIFVLYAGVAHSVMTKSERFLKLTTFDLRTNTGTLRMALKKEKATIFVCALVVVSFLVCNIPFISVLYRKKLSNVSSVLAMMNSVLNPLIYFFKGHLENRLAKRKAVVSFRESGGNGSRPTAKVLGIELYNKTNNNKDQVITISNSN
eukprot:Seg7819.1 transcript_id=Seg7819.1/GoldUCD/mRNA.D3Y31 product="Mas-related G-protein coupled receptor member B2" protein_id=Seg7819.1/GoldUCD/D3Y31